MAPLTQELFRRRPVPEMTGADSNSSELVRSIGLFQLSMFGIGPPSAPAAWCRAVGRRL